MIFVRLNMFSPFPDQLYRVDRYYPTTGMLKLVDSNGVHLHLATQFFRGLNKDRCVFFRGVAALLLQTAPCWGMIFIGDLKEHVHIMQEVERLVPAYLWADRRYDE